MDRSPVAKLEVARQAGSCVFALGASVLVRSILGAYVRSGIRSSFQGVLSLIRLWVLSYEGACFIALGTWAGQDKEAPRNAAPAPASIRSRTRRGQRRFERIRLHANEGLSGATHRNYLEPVQRAHVQCHQCSGMHGLNGGPMPARRPQPSPTMPISSWRIRQTLKTAPLRLLTMRDRSVAADMRADASKRRW